MRIAFALSCGLLLAKNVFAQTAVSADVKNYRHQWGLVFAKGVHTGYESPAFYSYKPVLFLAEYQKRLTKKKSTVRLDIVVQPQFGTVRFKDSLLYDPPERYTKSWEAGVNLNLLFRLPFYYNAKKAGGEIYLQGGTGPHYIHAAPARQSSGFIFSDNIFLGLRTTLTQRLLFDVRGGLRHLSNASLKKPNRGLDNVIVGAGIRLLQ